MSNKRSNNTLVWSIVPTAICIVCTIVIIILLCIYFPRHQELDFDYIGIIIGILSVLVTVLVGWNIYTAFDLSKRTKEIEDKVNVIIQNTENALIDIQQRTKEQLDKQSKQNTESEEYMLGAIDYVQGMIMINSSDPNKILNAKTFFSAISHFIKSSAWLRDRKKGKMEKTAGWRFYLSFVRHFAFKNSFMVSSLFS